MANTIPARLSRGLTGGALLAAALGLGQCSNPATTNVDMGGPTAPPLKGPSKSSTIAISDDDSIVAVVNSEDGSVSFFATASNTKMATVMTGNAPSAVVIAGDNSTAWVANRADATVVKITGVNTSSPSVSSPISVGSEPTGLALSPTAAQLYVAEFAESTIGVIDTRTMARTTFATSARNPRAVAVTNNNLGANDAGEMVIVPEFYGVPQAGGEGQNNGRMGMIHVYKVSDHSEPSPAIQLAPYINMDPNFEGVTSPNQLYAVAIAGTRIYVPTISASPAPPLNSTSNVYPVVHVADLNSRQTIVGSNGSVNLAELVDAVTPVPMPRYFLADLVDVAFPPTNSMTGYFVARGADAVQMVDFSTTPPTLGMPGHLQIDVQGTGAMTCQNPNGIVISRTKGKAYINCWGTRRMAVLDLTSQSVTQVVDSVTVTTPSAADRGRTAFFTGRSRWSGSYPLELGTAWSSCGSCHPDGLSDNITWIFNSGPRQTTSLDGTFSHSPGGTAQKQRMLNWTAINDEMHDFESNTRNVSGGLGALTTSTMCGTLSSESRSVLPLTGLGVTTGTNLVARDLQMAANNCTTSFDDINAWVQTIRPPKGRRFLDQASVTRGSMLFGGSAGCVKCHGGGGWTVSNRFYTPSTANNGAAGLPGVPFMGTSQSFSSLASPNTTQIAQQNATVDTAVAAAIPPVQLSCALRNVGTFGVPADQATTTSLEVRNVAFTFNGASQSFRAQGMGGYNVPSLYGLQLGAPYLHHGQAPDLMTLLSDTKWQTHWMAGATAGYTPGASDRADLANFLLSLDSTTAEQPVPQGYAAGCACPGGGTGPC